MVQVLLGLKGKCVTFKLVNGDQITGFVRGVRRDLITLFVAGKTVYIVSANVAYFTQATGAAC